MLRVAKTAKPNLYYYYYYYRFNTCSLKPVCQMLRQVYPQAPVPAPAPDSLAVTVTLSAILALTLSLTFTLTFCPALLHIVNGFCALHPVRVRVDIGGDVPALNAT